MKELILKHALKNAVSHRGRADANYLVPKLIGEKPELRNRMKELMPQVVKVVSEVNAMTPEEQVKKLKKLAPEMLEKAGEEKKDLPPLPGDTSKVVVRIPPGPEKYMHIGHAFSFMINYLYAKRYNGKVWLRFEDTNPEKCELEYYDAMRRDIRWLGMEWDYEKNETDSMELYYEKAGKLVEGGKAYVCTCDVEDVRKRRYAMEPCGCRSNTVSKNIALWERMFKGFRQGEAQLRLMGDMSSKDASFRDPMLFRINDAPHCLTGKKYRVWPGYDLANAIEDSECGITHVIRSNEFATELQKHLRALLGYRRQPEYVEYMRYNVIGAVTQGRAIREMIRSGKASGWDDPRLVTVLALRRRGIVPETFIRLIKDLGITKSRISIPMEKINTVNRKIIDPTTKRYFFVDGPVRIKVKGAPEREAKLPLHPDKELGFRTVRTSGTFYVPKADARGELRLKGLYNIKVLHAGEAKYTGDELKEMPKVQWVTEDSIKVDVLKPDGIVSGLAERAVSQVKAGETVQFERFGFCRKDDGIFVFSHA